MAPMKPPTSASSRHSLPLGKIAQRWHVKRRDVRRLLQKSELPFEQVNGQLRVPIEAVRNYESANEH